MATVTRTVALPDAGVDALVGALDENLRFIESSSGVRLSTQGHELLIEGETPNVERVEHLLSQLVAIQREGYRICNGDVRTAADLLTQDPGVDLRDYFLKAQPRTMGRRQIAAKSLNQRKYLSLIHI